LESAGRTAEAPGTRVRGVARTGARRREEGDEKSRAECRQEKREEKQEGREEGREIKKDDSGT